MTTTLTKFLASIFCGFIALTSFASATVHAESTCDYIKCANGDTACEAIKKANGCDGGDATGDIETTVANILSVVIGVSGTVAVVFIVIGGVGYMTSSGDAGKAKKAKDTILYAAIGLVICALSYAIVNWVIIDVLHSGSTDQNETTTPKDTTQVAP